MSKFFVQLLLSVMVGISAALGFNPQMKSQLHDVWQEAGTYLHERTNIDFRNATALKTDANADIAVQTVSKSSVNSREKIDLKVNSNVKIKSSNGNSHLGNLLPTLVLNSSTATQTQASAGTDTSDLVIKLKDQTQSTLKLNLGSGK